MKSHNEVPEVESFKEPLINETKETLDDNIGGPQTKVEVHYLCDHCTYEANEMKHLMDHKATVHIASDQVEIYCCDGCNYRTEQSSELKEHKKQAHNGPQQPAPETHTMSAEICKLIKNEISNLKTQTNFKLDMIVSNQRMLLDKINSG